MLNLRGGVVFKYKFGKKNKKGKKRIKVKNPHHSIYFIPPLWFLLRPFCPIFLDFSERISIDFCSLPSTEIFVLTRKNNTTCRTFFIIYSFFIRFTEINVCLEVPFAILFFT